MLMKSAYYISSSQTYSSMVEEDAFISYSIGPHTFNQAALVTIELADSDGSIMRKYDVDTNAVYVGPGAVEIWDPDASCLFMGRIIKARHNEKGNRVILLCQDWMSILNEERIKYDMREILDGEGGSLRQSTVRTHIEGSVKRPVARSMKAGVSKDAAVYADQTTETNSDTDDDMHLLPTAGSIEVGDGFLFGFNTGDKTELTINVSTAGVGSWYIDWDYSTGAGTWGNLSGVTDNTIGFKTAGINKVTWSSAPGDWAEATYDGKTAYWIKGDIDWITSETSKPLGAYAHGDYFMYDDAMRNVWSDDDWNEKYVVFTNEMAGSVTISTGPISEEIEIAPTMVTDTPTAGETAVWDDDHKYHWMADNGSNYRVLYTFVQPIELSSQLFIRGITGARVKCEYSLEDADEPPAWFHNRAWLFGVDIYDSQEIGKLTVDPGGTTEVTIQKATWEIPEQYLDYVLNDDTGECVIALSVDVDTVTPTLATLKVHKIRLEVDVDLRGYSSAVEIFDTQEETTGWSPGESQIFVGLHAVKTSEYGSWVFTDETTEVNNDTVNDVNLITQSVLSASRAFLFATDSDIQHGLRIIISTLADPQPPSDTIWQYSVGSGIWKNLLNVNDGTNGLTKLGTNYVTWTIPSNWAVDSFNGSSNYYWIRAYTPVSAILATSNCMGTRAWFVTFGTETTTTKLLVDRDLTTPGVGIYEGCPYSIVSPIWTHINGLVTGGDDLMELSTTGTVEETTGISTRHYDDRTRFEIMLDLAKMDSAVCWIPLGTKQVKWKSTFAGSTTNLTDSDVLSWDGGEYDYIPMFNEYHIGGIRIGDDRLYTETEDIIGVTDPGADSKTKYGATRTKVISSTGTVAQHDTDELGKALVEANEDVFLYLECVIAGLPTDYRLGDEINVTSAYLGLTDEKYVVTSFSYNSKSWRTKITLHPRTSSGFIDRTPFGEHLRRIGEQSRETMIDTFIPGLTSQRVD